MNSNDQQVVRKRSNAVNSPEGPQPKRFAGNAQNQAPAENFDEQPQMIRRWKKTRRGKKRTATVVKYADVVGLTDFIYLWLSDVEKNWSLFRQVDPPPVVSAYLRGKKPASEFSDDESDTASVESYRNRAERAKRLAEWGGRRFVPCSCVDTHHFRKPFLWKPNRPPCTKTPVCRWLKNRKIELMARCANQID